MSWKSLGRISDFFIKIVMMFTTVLILILYSSEGNQTLFSILLILFLLAMFLKGLATIFDKSTSTKNEKVSE